MKKKFLLLSAAAVAIAIGVVCMSAYEAHVINVTAHIENALSVIPDQIEFGTVFPEERLIEQIDINMSQSFIAAGRVDNVNYLIKQKPKPRPDAVFPAGITGHEWCLENSPADTGDPADPYYERCYPVLCSFLSKHDADPEDGNDGPDIEPFHPAGAVANGRLVKSEDDTSDLWDIDLLAPCFQGQCAQDGVVPYEYQLDPRMESEVFGCDLWVEVNGISAVSSNYEPHLKLLTKETIIAESGGELKINDPDSSLNGLKLIIPPGALADDMEISISEIENLPQISEGYKFFVIPFDLGPDGTQFNLPIFLEIPYTDEDLINAGVFDPSELKIYAFNWMTNEWKEVLISDIDYENKIIQVQISHFTSYFSIKLKIVIANDYPLDNPGRPAPGDLVYKLSSWTNPNTHIVDNSWLPGHVGIYVGEKIDSDNHPYNVIEALGEGVIRKNYNPIEVFAGNSIYMGAREPDSGPLIPAQRRKVVDFVESKVGVPYKLLDCKSDFTTSPPTIVCTSTVKGDNGFFNCVGLAEKAYELAEVNQGNGLISDSGEKDGPGLTPEEHYGKTQAAGSTGVPTCGDGIIEGNEVCDDNNIEDDDGCPSDCQAIATCPNGVLEGQEQCDDGNFEYNDGCTPDCKLEVQEPWCGDGIINQDSEVCDDGNNIDGDGCSAVCIGEWCGDGVVQAGLGEECEQSQEIFNHCLIDGMDGSQACLDDCTWGPCIMWN